MLFRSIFLFNLTPSLIVLAGLTSTQQSFKYVLVSSLLSRLSWVIGANKVIYVLKEILLLMIDLDGFSDFINIDPRIAGFVHILDDRNILEVIDHISLIIGRVLLQGFEEGFPSLDNVTEFLVYVGIFVVEGGVEMLTWGSRLIRVADWHSDIASFLVFLLFFPHQFIDIFLQFRQSVQYNILKLFAVLDLFVLGAHGVIELLIGGLLGESVSIRGHIFMSFPIFFGLVNCIFCCNPFVAFHDIGSAVIIGVADEDLIRVAVLVWREYSGVSALKSIGILASASTAVHAGLLQVFFEKDPGVYHEILAL